MNDSRPDGLQDDERGPARSMTDRTLRSIAWSSSGAVIQTVLQFGVLLVLARLLTPSDFGVVAAATLVLGFTQIFWQLGVGPALIQKPNLQREHLETGFTTSVTLGLLFASGIFFFAPAISDFFGMERLTNVLRAAMVVYIISGFTLVGQSLLRRELRFKEIAFIQLAAYVMYGIVAIALAIAGVGVWALVGGQIAQSVTEGGMIVRLQSYPKRLRVHRSVLGELLAFGGGVTAAQVANYVALQGDNFVVGRLMNASSLGLYGRSYNLMTMPANLFATAVDTVLFPAMSKVQEEPERLGKAFRRAFALTALIGLPLSALTYALAPEVVHVLLGSQWDEVIPLLRILALGVFFRTAYKLGASAARAKGAVHRIAWRQGVYAVAVIAGSWIGANADGLRGVAIAVLASLALIFLLLTHLGLRVTGIPAGDLIKVHVPPLLLAIVMLGVAHFSAEALRELELASILVLAGATALSLVVATIAGRVLPSIFLGEEGAWGVRTLGDFARGALSRKKVKTPQS